MQKNNSTDLLENIYFNLRVLQEIYPERPSMAELYTVDMGQFLHAANAVHFVMQNIVIKKFEDLSDKPVEEMQTSAFDEYDRQNGYEDDTDNTDIWQALKDNVDRVVKIATRVLNTGYKECMESDIVKLLDYVRFEIDTAEETQNEQS